MVVRVAQATASWLSQLGPDAFGFLIGNNADILGALRKLHENWGSDNQDVEKHLPGGLEVIGLYGTDKGVVQSKAKELSLGLLGYLKPDGQLSVLDEDGEVQEVEVVETKELLSDYVILRYSETRVMRTDEEEPAWEDGYFSLVPGQLRSLAVEDEEVTLSDAVTGASSCAIGGDDGAGAGAGSKKSEAPASKKKKKGGGGGKGGGGSKSAGGGTSSGPSSGPSFKDILRDSPLGPLADVSLYVKRTVAATMPGPCAIISSEPTVRPPTRRLSSEILVYASPSGSVSSVTTALVANLQEVWSSAKGQESKEGPIELLTYHVLPRGSGCIFPLRVTAPLVLESLSGSLARVPGQEDTDEGLREMRKRLHERTGLAMNRPAFRTTGALRLSLTVEEGASGSTRLQDVHVGLPPSGVQGGKQYLVDGAYLYYHYMQDSFDDRGWGCAYRSLQTIASFFLLNNYTTKPVPSHRQIQQTLVDMGDQQPEFVGSSKWIGSLEVGYYLDQELGVSWRNIFTNTGPELAEKARELAMHFETHGTPVMMGGGNLAFTILGIDWNENTGEVKFLILDPHYTGTEDLKTIQGKEVSMEGYRATPCGWRSASTFARHSFYNLCLPSRPSIY